MEHSIIKLNIFTERSYNGVHVYQCIEIIIQYSSHYYVAASSGQDCYQPSVVPRYYKVELYP